MGLECHILGNGKIFFLIAVYCLCFLFGCNREPGIYVEDGEAKTIEKMAEGDVLVTVNGMPVRKADYQRMRSLREKMFRIKNRYSMTQIEAKVIEFNIRTEQQIPDLLIRDALLRCAEDREGVTSTVETVEFASRAILKGLGRERASIEEIAKEIGGADGEAFRALVAQEARDEAYWRHCATNDFMCVSDSELDQGLKAVGDFNKTAKRLNAESHAKAEAARKEILDGGNFAEVTARCAQVSPEHGKEWQSVELGEIPVESELHKWLETAKGGDISHPLDLEDGVAIVGLLGKYKTQVPEGVTSSDTYDLVKCTFYAYESSAVPTREQLRDTIRDRRRKAVMKEIGERLFAVAVIEYPNGNKFFVKEGEYNENE